MTPKKRTVTIALSVTSELSHDQRMRRICRSLTATGYRVILTGRRLKGSPPLSYEPYQQHRIKSPFSRGPLFYAAFNIQLFFILLFRRADILVACDLDTILPNWLVSIIKGKKLVFDSHEFFTEVPELVDREFVKWCWNTVARISLPRAHACYTVSESLAGVLSARYRKPFLTIRNLPEASSGILRRAEPSDNVIIYQGNLNPGRGIEETILSLHYTKAKLTIAGDGPLKKRLEELVTSEKLENRVTFTGIITPELLSEITAGSMVGVNILDRSSLSYYYSLSNKFLNYILAGIPQICTDLPEYRKINDQWRVALFCEMNPESIAKAVNTLLGNRDLYQELRDNCSQAAGHLSWQEEEKKLLQIYYELST